MDDRVSNDNLRQMIENLLSRLGRGVNFTVELLPTYVRSEGSDDLDSRFACHRAYITVISNLSLALPGHPAGALQVASDTLTGIQRSGISLFAPGGGAAPPIDMIAAELEQHYDRFFIALNEFEKITGIEVHYLRQQERRVGFYKRVIGQIATIAAEHQRNKENDTGT